MILMAFLNKNKISEPSVHRKVTVGDKTIVTNSRGRIPVILVRIKRKNHEVIDLVYMDEDALLLSLSTGEVHVYKRSKGQIEKMLSNKGEGLMINSVKMSQNKRALLMNIGQGSRSVVLHTSFTEEIWRSSKKEKNKKQF